jgi:hypothetical protein
VRSGGVKGGEIAARAAVIERQNGAVPVIPDLRRRRGGIAVVGADVGRDPRPALPMPDALTSSAESVFDEFDAMTTAPLPSP